MTDLIEIRFCGRRAIAMTLILTALGSAPLSAQERLELLTAQDGQLVMADIDVSALGFGRIRQISPVPPQGPIGSSAPVAVAGARYLAWVNWGLSGDTPFCKRIRPPNSARVPGRGLPAGHIQVASRSPQTSDVLRGCLQE